MTLLGQIALCGLPVDIEMDGQMVWYHKYQKFGDCSFQTVTQRALSVQAPDAEDGGWIHGRQM